jgi:transcriptional regulator with XRE-family HTH domain
MKEGTLTAGKFKQIRIALALSRAELAERMGLSPLTIRKYEAAGNVPLIAELALWTIRTRRAEELIAGLKSDAEDMEVRDVPTL